MDLFYRSNRSNVQASSTDTAFYVSHHFRIGDKFSEMDAMSFAENPDGSIGLSIYPNPTRDFATVNAGLEGAFVVYAASGKVVMTGQLIEGENLLDVSVLPSGTYWLKSNGLQVDLVVE